MFDKIRQPLLEPGLSSYQLAKLHTFAVVARHGSFGLAAQALPLTPSAISHRMRALEEALNFKLFNRLHRRVTLTDNRALLYQVVITSLQQLNQQISGIKAQHVEEG